MFIFMRSGCRWNSRSRVNRGSAISRHESESIRAFPSGIDVNYFPTVEHGAAMLSAYISTIECAEFRGDADIIGTYFQLQFPQVRRYEYRLSIWNCILCIHSEYIWPRVRSVPILSSRFVIKSREAEEILPWTPPRIEWNRSSDVERLISVSIDL